MADAKLPGGGNNRQKVILIATVIVFIILIWQVYGMFATSTPPPAAKSATKKTATNANSNMVPPASEVVTQLPEAKIVNDPEFVKLQKQSEERYVRRLNDLEELRIQRQIAETNQGIAAARLATVTAEKNISELLTTPSAQAMAASAEYARQLAQQRATPENAEQNTLPPMPVVIDYQLISVSMQLHKWSAVIGYQGNLYSVTIGDRLPPDGSIVTNINRSSVILRKDDEVRRISIVSSI